MGRDEIDSREFVRGENQSSRESAEEARSGLDDTINNKYMQMRKTNLDEVPIQWSDREDA